MDSLRKRMPWLTQEQEQIIRRQLLERAAYHFERAKEWPEAAECWVDLGRYGRAAELYAHSGQLRPAAEACFNGGQYNQALELYRQWHTSLPAGDLPNRVIALLGQAACLHVMAILPAATGGRSEGGRKAALQHFHQARALIDSAEPAQVAARCWTALAEYGHRMNRPDLVHEGYEMALSTYEHTAGLRAEQISTARRYLATVKSYDRLLSRSIEERLAEWGAWDEGQPATSRPEWYRWRDEIETNAFKDGGRDVLHFTSKTQWAAWQELAKQEEAPEIDSYLRQLAPAGMVYIPPGPFLMGSPDDDPDANSNEKPQHELWLAGYYIDRTPVTNAQYRKFIEAGGYEQEQYWTEAGWTRKERDNWQAPRYWDNSKWNGETQPVVGVSWYEALAYARWAGKMLPAEPQWEKAAGWDPVARRKRKYPWGDEWESDRCNTKEAGLNQTSPVDVYSPQGDSAYGVADMGGNVWEWCSTRWDDKNDDTYPFPYQSNDGREEMKHEGNLWRVLRGGVWSGQGQNKWSRCGFRYRYFPGYRYNIRGFRCITPHVAFSPDSEF